MFGKVIDLRKFEREVLLMNQYLKRDPTVGATELTMAIDQVSAETAD